MSHILKTLNTFITSIEYSLLLPVDLPVAKMLMLFLEEIKKSTFFQLAFNSHFEKMS